MPLSTVVRDGWTAACTLPLALFCTEAVAQPWGGSPSTIPAALSVIGTVVHLQGALGLYINCNPVPPKMSLSTLLKNGILLGFTYSQNAGVFPSHQHDIVSEAYFPHKEIDKLAFQVCPEYAMVTLVLSSTMAVCN